MLKFSHHLALFFFNISGVFFFKYEDNLFKVSKIAVVWSIVATPLSILFFYFVITAPFLQGVIFDIEKFDLNQFSKLSVGLMVVAIIFLHYSAIGSGFLQLWKRMDLLKLLNEVNELHGLLDDGLKKSFYNRAIQNILISSLFCAINVLIQFSILKMSAVTFVISFVISRPYLVTIGFLACIKTFESFLVVLMQDFDKNLETFLKKPKFDFDECQRLATNYRRFYRLHVKFNTVFGFALTTITCYYTIITTLIVKNFYKHLGKPS